MACHTQPLQVLELIRATVCQRYPVVTAATFRRPSAGLAGVLISPLDPLHEAPPWAASSALTVGHRVQDNVACGSSSEAYGLSVPSSSCISAAAIVASISKASAIRFSDRSMPASLLSRTACRFVSATFASYPCLEDCQPFLPCLAAFGATVTGHSWINH
jgi:hypothetical protein